MNISKILLSFTLVAGLGTSSMAMVPEKAEVFAGHVRHGSKIVAGQILCYPDETFHYGKGWGVLAPGSTIDPVKGRMLLEDYRHHKLQQFIKKMLIGLVVIGTGILVLGAWNKVLGTTIAQNTGTIEKLGQKLTILNNTVTTTITELTNNVTRLGTSTEKLQTAISTLKETVAHKQSTSTTEWKIGSFLLQKLSFIS